MPSERHIIRQLEWKRKLEPYGRVELEKQLLIKGAKVIVDVYAVIENKEFIIEIGGIADPRKYALLQFYAESKPNVTFIHEPYSEDKTQEVLEDINAYLNSPEYQSLMQAKKLELKKLKKEYRKNQFSFYTLIILLITCTFLSFNNIFETWVVIILWVLFILFIGPSTLVSLLIIREKIKKIEQQVQNEKVTSKDAENGIVNKKEEPEYDVTYGEDTWEQEDDEWTEELDSTDEMEW